jgi:DNA-binding CsgD family transcriptional regulator
MVAAIRRQIARTGDRRVQVVRGGSQVAAMTYGSSASARAESLSLEPWQAFIPKPELLIGDEIDLAQTKRGVDQRVVIAQSAQSRNDTEVLAQLAQLGDPARYNPAVPLRLIVYDRHKAFIAIDPANTRAGAYVTTDPGIVALACQVFQDVWQDATLPTAEPASTSPFPGQDLVDQVLAGLAAGATDDAIARRLGVSARTVRRAIAELQRGYGTTSRFQLALVLAGQGGVPRPRNG